MAKVDIKKSSDALSLVPTFSKDNCCEYWISFVLHLHTKKVDKDNDI